MRYGTDMATIRDIQVLKTYGAAPYAAALKRLEKQIKERQTSVNEKIGQSADFHRDVLAAETDNFSRGQGRANSERVKRFVLITPRNRIRVSHHRIYGILLQIGKECKRITLYKSPGVRRSYKMRKTRIRANTSSMLNKSQNS